MNLCFFKKNETYFKNAPQIKLSHRGVACERRRQRLGTRGANLIVPDDYWGKKRKKGKDNQIIKQQKNLNKIQKRTTSQALSS